MYKRNRRKDRFPAIKLTAFVTGTGPVRPDALDTLVLLTPVFYALPIATICAGLAWILTTDRESALARKIARPAFWLAPLVALCTIAYMATQPTWLIH